MIYVQIDIDEWLVVYNGVCSDVGVVLFIWNLVVYDYVFFYVLIQVDSCWFLIYFIDSFYGENLVWFSNVLRIFIDVVVLWVEEEQYYDYVLNFCVEGEMCGYYIQVVWGDIMSVGCVLVDCFDGGIYFICSYDFFRNVEGE